MTTTASAAAVPDLRIGVGGRGARRRFARALAPLGQLAIVVLVTTTALFFLLRSAGDPALVLGGELASPEALEAIRARYGLDQPLIVQYLAYLGNSVRLDFGISLIHQRPALPLVLDRLAMTATLAAAATAVSGILSLLVGVAMGAARRSRFTPTLRAAILLTQGVPGFVFALVCIQVFAVTLRWLPSIAGSSPASWVLPIAALVFLLAPRLTLVIEASVADALREDYVRTARGLGAGEVRILFGHVLPNALPAAIAVLALQFGSLLSGAMIIEVIFGAPGIGRLLVESVLNLDFPVVQAAVVVLVVLVFAITLLSERLLAVLDPRRSATP